ncbi:MAG TPA: S-methyl-5-thioribose-1-phosphate isomerase [Gemmatimonadales bacterium]|nr:S-methyl-5-thioribose-1-phosphate isomerase [Gemmatimonadales bacterium]
MSLPQPITWTPDGIRILDQTLLPLQECYLTLDTVTGMAEAISLLRVRGAPLIGIAGAYGVALAARQAGTLTGGRVAALRAVEAAAEELVVTRPTAVNLRWAIERMLGVARAVTGEAQALAAALEAEALAIHAEDREMCACIGRHGLAFVPDGATVLTHCNAGALATGGMGTALAPIYTAHAAGRRVRVVADETRPLLQGSRLTAWELSRAGIDVTVIADNMAASRLRRGDVAAIFVGADRIAANGDTANKIGTYPLALAARAHGVPFYVAAPRSTFDPAIDTGAGIPIEERVATEVTALHGTRTAPEGVGVWNPAFDVTPAELITGFITDAGVLRSGEIAARLGR